LQFLILATHDGILNFIDYIHVDNAPWAETFILKWDLFLKKLIISHLERASLPRAFLMFFFLVQTMSSPVFLVWKSPFIWKPQEVQILHFTPHTP